MANPTNATFTSTPTPNSIPGYSPPTKISASTPGVSNLGWGVNAATGDILSPYLQPIMDEHKLVDAIHTAGINNSTSITICGESSDAYLQEQTLHVGISGSYAGFSGSLSSSFGLTTGETSTQSLAQYSNVTELYQLTIPAAKFQDLLSTGFKTDLENMDPQDFYALYGAYFISTVIVGGTLSTSIKTQATTNYSNESLSVAASASYKSAIASGKVNVGYEYNDATTDTTYQSTSGLVRVGGTPSFNTDGSFDQISWIQSIPENPTIIGFGASGLIPMWELATNTNRQNDLKNALSPYFVDPLSIVTPLSIKVFNAASPKITQPYIDVMVDAGYKVIGGGALLQQDDNGYVALRSSNVVGASSPNQWNSSAMVINGGNNDANLVSYAIGVYDPDDLLDVRVFSSNDSPSSYNPSAYIAVGDSYVMSGGGATINVNNNLILTASCPDVDGNQWFGQAAEHDRSGAGTITVSAIGVKWKEPANKPKLVTKHLNLTSIFAAIPSQSTGVAGNCVLVGGGAQSSNNQPSQANWLQNSYPLSPTQWYGSSSETNQKAGGATMTTWTIGLQAEWQSTIDGSLKTVPFGPGCLIAPAGYATPTS